MSDDLELNGTRHSGCWGALFLRGLYLFGLLDLGMAGVKNIEVWPNHEKNRDAHPDYNIKLEKRTIGGFWMTKPDQLKGIIKVWPFGEIRIIARKAPENSAKSGFTPSWRLFPYSQD